MPTPGAPASASRSTPGRSAEAITTRTPDQAAILAAASFDAMPPLPRSVPAPPASASTLSTSMHLLDQRGALVDAGVGREQPGGVGQQDEQVGLEQVRHQGGQAVVVPEADLVVGHGVVLVDHRDDAQAEQDAAGSGGRAGTGRGS